MCLSVRLELRACDSATRSDRWCTRLTIEDELATEGAGQRYYCHCGARYGPKFWVLVEFIDVNNRVAYYFRATHPTEDINDVKTCCREIVPKAEGHKDATAKQLLQHLPTLEPFAMGGVFEPYAENDQNWKGPWVIQSQLDRESLP